MGFGSRKDYINSSKIEMKQLLKGTGVSSKNQHLQKFAKIYTYSLQHCFY